MVNITKEMYENNSIEVITDNLNTLWLNERHVEQQLGHKNLRVVTNKYNEEYRKRRYELIYELIKQSHRRFVHSDLALKIIMACRTDEPCNLKRNLGFRLHDVINTKEQKILKSVKDAFEVENMQTQYSVLWYKIDQLGDADRNVSNEIERQKTLEKEFSCVFIRINYGEENFNIFKEINKIYRHIKKTTKKQTEGSTKKSLIDDLSKRSL